MLTSDPLDMKDGINRKIPMWLADGDFRIGSEVLTKYRYFQQDGVTESVFYG